MAIFNSYVKLPEGMDFWMENHKDMFKWFFFMVLLSINGLLVCFFLSVWFCSPSMGLYGFVVGFFGMGSM